MNSAKLIGESHLSANLSASYNFAPQLLCGAKILVDRAHDAENQIAKIGDSPESLLTEYRALVTASIFQVCACLDADVSDVASFGPGRYLGSNAADLDTRNFLQPLSDTVNRIPLLERSQFLLSLLRKDSFKGDNAYGRAVLLVQLRNALVHYKSDEVGIFEKILNIKGLNHPVFLSNHPVTIQVLSAPLATWALETGILFLTAFHSRLECRSWLLDYQDRLGKSRP